MNITTQVITQNSSKTIARLLDSVVPLQGEVIIADLGSTDKTIEICESYNTRIFKIDIVNSLSDIRNRIVVKSKYDMQLLLYPKEILTDHTPILAMDGPAYYLSILQGDLLTKEIRLWNKTKDWKFLNPVYEYLDVPESIKDILPVTVYSTGMESYPNDLLDNWKKKEPASQEPLYYGAIRDLSYRNWDGFISNANKYLFGNKTAEMSVVLTKYYYATVMCHIKKDPNASIKHILECIAVRPLMAEFWCLLGDIHYFLMSDYRKAKQFYMNAMVLGQQRPHTDLWPLEINKYKIYPQKMIDSCTELLTSGKVVFV